MSALAQPTHAHTEVQGSISARFPAPDLARGRGQALRERQLPGGA